MLLTLFYGFSFSENKGYVILEIEIILKNVCCILLCNKRLIKVKIKVKVTLEQATKDQRRS